MYSGIDIIRAPVNPAINPMISNPLGIYYVFIACAIANMIALRFTNDVAGPIGPLEQALAIHANPIVFMMDPKVPIIKYL